MKIEKSQYQSAIITAIVSALILLLLFLLGISAERNEMDEGVMVSFGDVDEGFGEQTPQEVEENATPEQEAVTPTVTQPTPAVQEKVMTQEDPSVALEKERQRKAAEEAERVRKEEEAKRAKAAKVAGNAFKKVGNGSGDGEGDGKKGNPAGHGSSGGNSWSLAGRSLVGNRLAQPSYSGNEQGIIVVNIRVDASGVVVDANIGTGTTITSEEVRNAAIKAAKKNKFSTGNSPAVGTITYKFTLN